MFISLMLIGAVKRKSVPAGAATQRFSSTAPELAGRGGSFLADCKIAEISPQKNRDTTVVWPCAIDPEAAGRLWSLSEDLVDERFTQL